MSRTRIVVAVTALALAASASAQEVGSGWVGESPRKGSFQLVGSTYRPNIDADLATNPYQDVFGKGRGWMFRALGARALYVGVGTLEAGLGVGYFQDTGKGRLADGTAAAESTALHVLPVSASVTYRFDYLADRYRVPLMFYGRASLERYHWWVSNESDTSKESGATNGYSFTGGVGLLLDILDRGSARELDRETGINHTWLTFDVTKSKVDDFGSSKSWDLSDEKLSLGFGVLFVF